MWFAVVVGIVVFLCCVASASSKKGKKRNKADSRPVEMVRINVQAEKSDDGFMRHHYEDHLQEAIRAGNEKEIKYYSAKLDPEFQIASEQYWSHDMKIRGMRTDQTVSKDEFEKACQDQMLRAYAFKPLYEKSYSQPLNADVFKSYAIFLEREGRYIDAATVCAKALRWGFPNDKTQGGMAGRLVRMVKKAGGETTPEIEDALKKFCQ